MADNIELNIEAEGVSGKAMAWSIIASLLIGFGMGWWFIPRFEPSEEYVEAIAQLEVSHRVARDSIQALVRVIEETDESALRSSERAQEVLESSRVIAGEASRLRRRADSLQAIRADESDVELLIEENVALREANEVMVIARTFRVQAMEEMQSTIVSQRIGIASRDAQIGIMARELDEQGRTLQVAMGEIARATGRIGGSWYLPKLTVGMGCAADGYCGPVVAAGIAVDPWRWF